VGSELIVVVSPSLDRGLSLLERNERVLVQTFVAQFAVEAFDVRVLHGLARSDEMQLDPVTMCPRIEHAARELRAVVDRDHLRQTVIGSELL